MSSLYYFHDINSVRDVEVIAKDIQNLFSKPFFLGDREVFASASMGIAHSDNDYKTPEEILRDAELAMYRAKREGKSQRHCFPNHNLGNLVFHQSIWIPISDER